MQNTPLAPFALSLILGIVAGHYFHIQQPLLLTIMVAVVVAAFLCRQRPSLQSLLLSAGFLVAGMAIAPAPESPHPATPFEGVVISESADKPKTVAVDVLIPEGDRQLRLYIGKDERARRLRIGDGIVVEQTRQAYVGPRSWHPGGQAALKLSTPQRLKIQALQWRHRLLMRYRQSTASQEEAYGVLAAMTLGDKSALSRSQRDTFATTGASHVLALSGLHLGIIYMLLTRLMAGRRRHWLKQSLLILSIWAFAFLTGLSTSMVRAAVMLTVFSLFAATSRQRASLNRLCLTAMVMLFYDSSQLFDIGFQLSFTAVFSILLCTPLMERLVSQRYLMEHRLQRWLWSMLTVTLAAQIGTAPLIAYHFGQFSTYFLLTNLFVLPVTTLILYGALLFLLTSWSAIGTALLTLVTILGRGLALIAALPEACIRGLHPSVLQVCMVYVVIASLCIMADRLLPDKNTRRKFA